MRKPIPPLLWVTVALLGLSACAHLGLALKDGSARLFVAALVEALLAGGLIHGQKWTYILCLAFVAAGVMPSVDRGIAQGLVVLLLDTIIVAPLAMCTSFFFPESSGLSSAEQTASRQ